MTSSEGDTPLSFDDLPASDWQDPPSDPASETPPVSEPPAEAETPAETPPAGATTPPAEPETNGVGSDPKGPIPYERHKATLEAERQKYSELESRMQRVAGFQSLLDAGITPETVQQFRQVYEEFQNIGRDPRAFISDLLTRVEQDPQLATVGREWAERILGNGHGNGADDPEPQADLRGQLADGTLIPQYSPTRLQEWRAWNQRQVRRELAAEVDQRIGPLERAEQARVKAEQETREQNEANARAQAEHEGLQQKYGKLYDDLFPKVAEYEKANRFTVPLTQAFLHVLATQHLPQISSTVKAQTVAELKTQAAASSARPSASAPSTPREPMTFADIPREEWQ